MCFAPLRALFEQLNFQKRSEEVCFYLLAFKCASRRSFWLIIPPDGSASSAVASLLYFLTLRSPKTLDKHSVSRLCLLLRSFSRNVIFFLLILSPLTFPAPVAASVHGLEVWLLNPLRLHNNFEEGTSTSHRFELIIYFAVLRVPSRCLGLPGGPAACAGDDHIQRLQSSCEQSSCEVEGWRWRSGEERRDQAATSLRDRTWSSLHDWWLRRMHSCNSMQCPLYFSP